MFWAWFLKYSSFFITAGLSLLVGLLLYRITTQAPGTLGTIYYHTDKKPRIDALIAKQRVTLDRKKRYDVFKEIQGIVRDDAPWIFLYDQQDIYGVTKRIQWTPRPDEFIWAYDIKVQE